MIKTFADKRSKGLYETGKAKGLPADIEKRAARKLEYIDLSSALEDLRTPRGNRLHELEDDRKGQQSISINDQWKMCFRFEQSDAYEVEVCDYH
ncbi:MAG: type II toxin-antitoxin system RelE/ParE family toxin [Xanthomonadales bacterium]|nr:type II toxin-antitoxin system RelE/ParE family toxin [Xanthomonadales bacterium]